MIFNFTKENLTPRQKRLQRIFEILPGAFSWGSLLGLIFLSIFFPFIAAVLIVAFYLSWIMRILFSVFFLVLSYFQLNIESKTNWIKRIEGIDTLHIYLKNIQHKKFGHHWRQKISHDIHLKQLQLLINSNQLPPTSKDIVHLILFPIAKERRDILEPTLAAIKSQDFPLKQIIIILALEERASAEIKEDVFALEKTYKDIFMDCLTIIHPALIAGEAKVKGANASWAAREAVSYFNKNKIALDQVIISCFDADTIVSPRYFSCLTYHFMVCPNRQRASFQPIPVYHNNIWHVPGFARVIETASSFYQLAESTNPEKLVTFSSHSMSFKALVETGFWPVDMISDDSAIFWKAYIHYDGQYQVVPMYVTLSMDVASAENWWNTVKSVYKQKQRWAWGVENFPIVMRAFLKAQKIPLYERLRLGFKLFEGHLSWATSGFILSFIGWLPIIFARQEFAQSVVYYNVPDIANTIFTLSFVSMAIIITLSLAILPPTKIRYRWLIKIGHAFEWLLAPFILVFFSALPALHAQTKLMLGQYLEFWVTEKHRPKKKTNISI